jgi:glycosyltransferase involved in cell wall biosynthesis
MHIIIDIRSRGSQDIYRTQFGEYLWKLWKQYAPHDTVLYLVNENVQRTSPEYIQAQYTFFGLKKKPFRQNVRSQEIFRCINVSPFSPYDPSIPTLTYLPSLTPDLYPRKTHHPISGKWDTWNTKKILSESTKIVVPHISVGKQLTELYNYPEDKIEIIPYPHLEDRDRKDASRMPSSINISSDFVLYDGGYEQEANIPGLLWAWAQFCELFPEKNTILILSGFAGHHLLNLTQSIRSFHIEKRVQYTWFLTDMDRISLYAHASAWIYIGSAIEQFFQIELARSFGVPLILSDIPVFEHVSCEKIHPNHLENLPNIFANIGKRKILNENNTWIPLRWLDKCIQNLKKIL